MQRIHIQIHSLFYYIDRERCTDEAFNTHTSHISLRGYNHLYYGTSSVSKCVICCLNFSYPFDHRINSFTLHPGPLPVIPVQRARAGLECNPSKDLINARKSSAEADSAVFLIAWTCGSDFR